MDSFEKRDPCKVMIATLKHSKNLLYVEACINIHEKRDSSAKSVFHWRILKCRQLIFSDTQIMASPILGTENLIYIVMDQTYFYKGNLKELFTKLNLTVKDPKPITNRIYESCLHYTILARIAPQWNQVGNFLVQGRDFLSSNQPLPGVKLDICVNDVDIFIILWPMKIRLQQTNIDDLNISAKLSQEFQTKTITSISEMNIGIQWVHVLPLLKKGQIVSISHQIPNTCPYRSYRELKRHWKNMYGYRLPEEENNMIYYNISFNFINPTLYTYPSLCLKANNMTVVHRVNEVEILRRFHDDLLKKFPSLCGNPLFINKNLVYAVPKLYKSSMESCSSFLPYPNLKLSDLIEIQPIITPSPILFQDVDNTNLSQDNAFPSHASQAVNICSSNVSFMTQGSSIPLQPSAEVTVIPHNTSQSPKTTLLETSLSAFPFQRKQNWGRNDLDAKNLGMKKFLPTENTHRDLQFIQRVVQVDQNLVVSATKSQFSQVSVSNTKTNISNGNKSNSADSEMLCSSSEQTTVTQNSCDTSDIRTSNFTSTQNIVMDKTRVYYQPTSTIKKSNCSQSNIPENKSFNDPSQSVKKEEALTRETFYLAPHDLGPIAKKPRARPQVQPDIDVELLARNNDLGRVNTATLVYWLRNKLVPCKVKDKKSELVNKVKQYLNIPLENVQ